MGDNQDMHGSVVNLNVLEHSPQHATCHKLSKTPALHKVEKTVRQLKNKAAAGADGIPAETLKCRRKELLLQLHTLVCFIRKEESILGELRDATVMSIFRKGKSPTVRTPSTGAVTTNAACGRPCAGKRYPPVLNQAKIPSVAALSMLDQLPWAGHIIRMTEEQMLYSQLQNSRQAPGGQRKDFSDTLKASLAECDIPTDTGPRLSKVEERRPAPQDLPPGKKWKLGKNSKESTGTPMPHPFLSVTSTCPKCNRARDSHTGLIMSPSMVTKRPNENKPAQQTSQQPHPQPELQIFTKTLMEE
eukprot:g41888.t1